MQANFSESTMKVFTIVNLYMYSFRKKISVTEFLAGTYCTHGIAETARWPCEPIILSIGHFKGPAEVQVNNWRKGSSLCMRRN